MGLRLNRNLGAPAHLVAGEFCVDAGETHVCCPICGTVTVIDSERHVVAPGGRVTPAWACPACPFMDWLELGSFGDAT